MRFTSFVAAAVLVAGFASGHAGSALAQAVEFGNQPSVNDITDALTPKRRTRSIVFNEPAQPVEPPTARFRIEFEYNSADLTPAAKQTLAVLGKALAVDSLAKFRFKIAGHTDAAGSEEYNASLSERRAQSVRRYLMEHWAISPARLIPEGMGESQPLNSANPYDGSNRRVEVINLGGVN